MARKDPRGVESPPKHHKTVEMALRDPPGPPKMMQNGQEEGFRSFREPFLMVSGPDLEFWGSRGPNFGFLISKSIG